MKKRSNQTKKKACFRLVSKTPSLMRIALLLICVCFHARAEVTNVRHRRISPDMLNVADGNALNRKVEERQIILSRKSWVSPATGGQNTVRVTGTVTDTGGEPIAGANILEKGTTNGTVTDVDGKFSLNTEERAVLLVSFIGYVTQEVRVSAMGGGKTLDIKLVEDAQALSEVVVVGYGVQKKVNLTGAVAQVTAAELENRSVSNASQILQGTMPNVNITFATGGEPGASGDINVRGIASINGGDPLVLIDGVPGDINRINPRDIESVSVLKDAAASAVYGARGAFGVILVTTKHAQTGKMNISYGAFFATSSPTVSTDFLTTGYDHVMLNDEAFRRATGNTYTRYSEEDYAELEARRYDRTENPARPWVVVKNVNGRDIYNYYGNYDWWNTVFNERQPSQSHSLSLSGGTEKLNFLLSGNFYTKEGIMKVNTDKFSSYNFRAKINAQIFPFLKVTSNTAYYDKTYDYYGREGGGNPNFVYVTVHALPAYAPVNPDGTPTYNTLKNNYSIGDGLFALLLGGNSKGAKGIHEFTTTTGIEADIAPDIKLNADYTYNVYIADNWYRTTVAKYSIEPGKLEDVPNYNTDQLKKELWFDPMHVFNVYANYNHTFGKHAVGATAGINFENKQHARMFASRKNLISQTLNDLSLGTGDMTVEGGAYDYTLFGAFFRANYDYNNRYLIEVNGRYDGTSRFRQGMRFGFFPSVSAGWRISEESFFETAKEAVGNLKLRASYGSLGNQAVNKSSPNYYPYISTMGMSLSTWLIDGQKTQNVSAPNPITDVLTWEKATTVNGGLDMSLFGGRLNVSADAYVRNTVDMLVPGETLPAVFGASSPQQNAGNLRTKGYELVVGWKDGITLGGKPFGYGISVSLGDATSEITKYNNPNKLLSNHYVGKKWGEIWGYRLDGYFKTDEEANNWTIDQTLVNTQIQRAPGEWGRLRAGDLKFVDVNGDGAITPGKQTADDPGDMVIIGNSQPRYNYGINLSANWNGLDVSIFMQGIGRRDWYPSSNADKFWGPYSRPYFSFLPVNFERKIWSEDNPDAYFPVLRGYTALNSGGCLNSPNDRYIQNIGYLRLKNIVAGYALPERWIRKAGIQRCRLYVSGENVFVLTPFETEYIDPEQPVADSNGRSYPLAGTMSVGLDITF
ncbi:MAG: TonB-dependent receptor [Tannerella sp.]|jgi:TonB-linked SusC/RagA family outer membrane protein|nr:TonB-dependent receptor [Tannerella sp.]